ncbi:hypothetical protein BOX15_Mlig032991g2 [Macrostomum lignano]|uniref:Uncharacterized protein n=1 Tax=Macrostomum lignano TaxID=282301 RepID=A0A267FIP6_9PLAT|nr:hypothetical protein BOX15_Mlig032991g2 [Macrostomum lignano]
MEKERTAQVEASSGRKTDKAFPKTVLIQANTVSIGYLICSVSIPLTMLCIANINTACIALQRGLFCTASKSTGSFEWTQWTSCSLSCGSQQNRSRPAGSNRPAEVETRPCPTENSTLCKFASGFQWTDWSSWTPCRKSCIEGVQQRTRSCQDTSTSRLMRNDPSKCLSGTAIETQSCNVGTPCGNATWTHWSQWGLCKQIKSPLKFRFRECVSDNMNVADKYCAGLYFESDVCNF